MKLTETIEELASDKAQLLEKLEESYNDINGLQN